MNRYNQNETRTMKSDKQYWEEKYTIAYALFTVRLDKHNAARHAARYADSATLRWLLKGSHNDSVDNMGPSTR